MGIDLKARHKKKGARSEQKSDNPYMALLVKLYRFLARRTGSPFNETVLKRLYMSRTSRAPVSTSRLAKELKGKSDKVIAVVVGTITHDPRLPVVPKMTVCALRISRQAREAILKAGGTLLRFDQVWVCFCLVSGVSYTRTPFPPVGGSASSRSEHVVA